VITTLNIKRDKQEKVGRELTNLFRSRDLLKKFLMAGISRQEPKFLNSKERVDGLTHVDREVVVAFVERQGSE